MKRGFPFWRLSGLLLASLFFAAIFLIGQTPATAVANLDPGKFKQEAALAHNIRPVDPLQTAPGMPVLLFPTYNAVTDDATPDFDWDDVSGASGYQLQVDNQTDFSSPVISNTIAVSNYTPSSSLPSGLYAWRVQASDTAGNRGSWSATWTFTIGTNQAGSPTTDPYLPPGQTTPTSPSGYPPPAATTRPAATSAAGTPPVSTSRPGGSPPPGTNLTPTRRATTPRPTGTLIPLPDITLLFPAITPTHDGQAVALQAPRPSPTSIPGLIVLNETTSIPPRIGLLGAVILAVWALLGGFLFVYLRYLGH